jgi:hypothetical protein
VKPSARYDQDYGNSCYSLPHFVVTVADRYRSFLTVGP